MATPRLLAITPPSALAPAIDPGLVDAWLGAGAGEVGLAVLLREPRAAVEDILADRRLWPLREALARAGVPALVSVDPRRSSATELGERLATDDLALAGVQLRGDPSADLVARWREVLGPTPLIARSVHGREPSEAPAASYTCLAPIFAPQTRLPGERKPAIGLDSLRRWAAACPNLFALGGISPATAPACLAAGAHGLAGIRLFFGRNAEAGHNVAALVEALASAAPDDDVSQAPPGRG